MQTYRCPPAPWGCDELKPVTEFPRFQNNDNRCAECIAKASQTKKQFDYEKRVKLHAQQLIAVAQKKQIDAPHVSEMCAEVMKWKGGLPRFVDSWMQQIAYAEQAKPGSQTVLNAYGALMRLTIESSKHRSSAPDMAGMGDEELVSEIISLLNSKGLKVVKDDGDELPCIEQQPEQKDDCLFPETPRMQELVDAQSSLYPRPA